VGVRPQALLGMGDMIDARKQSEGSQQHPEEWQVRDWEICKAAWNASLTLHNGLTSLCTAAPYTQVTHIVSTCPHALRGGLAGPCVISSITIVLAATPSVLTASTPPPPPVCPQNCNTPMLLPTGV
jgi:hypothetical protein